MTVPKFDAAQRAAFIAAARSFMGARWKHQGRRPDAMDCLGLVVLALRAVGVAVEDRQGYGRTPYNRQLAAALRAHFGEPVDDLQPGDIVTMSWAGEEHHVAILTDHPEGLGVIHSLLNAPGGSRVVEHRLSPDHRARIVEAYRP
jgi:cell wall-associated NlpC family hydrolase